MNKKQLLWAWLLALMLPATLSAQTWTASAPADGTFYLYNVGREAFMYGHNDWDTRASLTKEGGIPFTLISSGEAYYLSSGPTYIVSETDKSPLYLGSDGYVDKLTTSSKYAKWTFTPVTGLENTYTMRNSVDNKYIVAHNSDATKTSMVDAAPTTPMGYWKLVTKADLIAAMSNADADHPVDATWAFMNPYIGRVTDKSFWQGSPAFDGINDNFCFEKWNTTFDVYQEINGMPNGIYELKCQGFYRTGNTGNDAHDAAATRKAGNPDVLNAMYYINTADAPLKSIFDYDLGNTNDGTYNSSTAYDIGSTIYVPNNMKRAAACFKANQYWNTPIRTVVTDGKLRIGVKKSVTNASDWSIFDNFVVTYYGIDMSAMIEQATLNWHSKYDDIVNQAIDRGNYDTVMTDAAISDYCTTEEKLAEYDGIVWQAVCDVLQDADNANVLFDLTSLIENPSFDTGVGGWTAEGTPGHDGKYFVAEFFDQSDASLTQTLANMPAGTYTLKAQAFYRSADWRIAVINYQLGTDVVKGSLMLGNASKPICNIYDQTRYQPAYLAGVAGGSSQKMAPNSTHGASATFDIGDYWNLLSTTTTANADLTLGLNIVGGLKNNWMCFDNFRLYYGNPSVAVDLTQGVPTEDTQATTVNTGITLNAGEYNKICLPFDLDATKTAATFSNVYTLAGVTSDGVGQLVPAYSIEAGKAYFVTVDATKTLTVNDVLVKVAQPDSIPVMWEGAATVGKFDGFTFDINGTQPTSLAPVDFQNVSFVVNQENWRVRRFLNEFTYTDASVASKVSAYNAGHPVRLDQPHSVFIPVPQNNAALTVTVSTSSDYSENPETFTFPAGTTLCEVPNLIPQNTYYYKVEAGSVLTQGQFQTEGHLRMIKANTGFNIRDLGGWMNLDGHCVRYGKIFRGGELNIGHEVSADDLAELRRLGIAAEIDLRSDADCGGTSPTESALGSDAAYLYMNQDYNSNMFVTHQEDYERMFNFTLENLRDGKAVYFHCRIGADRTGSYGLLLDGLCGMTFDQLCKEYELTTFSEAGTRPWDDTGWLNLHEKLEYIQTLPGSTLQRQFFYYMNTEVGISADDLFEFIDIMVGDATSLENCDLTFNDLSNAYLQSLDEVGASCSLGSTVKEGAKAQLYDGETTIPVDMTIDNITVTFSGFTLEPGKDYTITIPAGAVQKDGVENAAEAFTTFHTPVAFDGIYYLYNQFADGFLSSGSAWGTQARVDKYGLPIRWTADHNGVGTIYFIDTDTYLYGHAWSFVDGLNNDDRPTNNYSGEVSNVEGYEGVRLIDNGHNSEYHYLYVYFKPNNGDNYNCASNGFVGDNCDKAGQSVWQFWTKEQRDARINNYPTQNIENVITASGITADATTFATVLTDNYAAVDLSNAVGTTSFGSGVGNWTYSETSGSSGYPDYNNREGKEFARLYEATGTYTLTVPAANVPAGIYKVELGAFERHASEALDTQRWNDGYGNPSTSYLAANGQQAQFTSWYQMNQNADAAEQSAVYTSQSLTQQAAFVDAGYADISLYVYLDGATDLNLSINIPSRIGQHYAVFNNLRLTQYVPAVTISEDATKAPAACNYANVTLERTLQPGIWNNFSVPFDLSADQIAASDLAGATIYGFASSDATTITFATVTAIEAGKPYLVRLAETVTENVVNPTFAGVTVVSAEGETQGEDGTVQFVGQIYNKPLEGVADVCYLSTKTQKLKKLSANGAIKGLRCYFIVPGASTTAAGIKLIFDTPTGIEEVETTNNEVHSTDVVYDLQGRRVSTPAKGIYIVNGKKVYVK